MVLFVSANATIVMAWNASGGRYVDSRFAVPSTTVRAPVALRLVRSGSTYTGSYSTDRGVTWHAVDTLNYNVNLFHFARAHGKKTSDVLFWAVTIINCPREMRDVRLSIGSNAASVWWVNGKEVIGIYGDRQTVIDDGVSKRLTLNQGPNVVRAAIVNGGGATDFCARFLDAEDKPLKEITVSLGEFRATPSH